jgi:sirohydrochlorin cobaltochelatase
MSSRAALSLGFLVTLALACGGGTQAGGRESSRPEAQPAPAPGGAPARKGLLLMAHGGTEEWNAAVEAAVAPLRARWEVEVCYGMAVSSALEASMQRLEARGVTDVAVVRLFVSGDSWREETEYILGLRAELPARKVRAHAALPHHGGGHGGHRMEAPRPIAHRARVAMSRDGVGDSPLIDRILLDRVEALSTEPARETILVIAHGPGDDAENERWIARMKERLEPLHSRGHFRKVEVATLREDWPEKRPAAERRIRSIVEQGSADGRVIVVPFRIAGFGPYREVLKGLTYVSDGAGFLPHENVTRWIEQSAEALLESIARR